MADMTRLRQLVEQLRNGIDELARELARGNERSAAGDRSAAAPASSGMPNVIPPTPTGDPDSIVGGHTTTDFPDCCAVGNRGGYYCTGTLIAPNLVVTARHCTDVSRVFVGGTDVTLPDLGEEIEVAEQFASDEIDLRVLVLAKDAETRPRRVASNADVPTGAGASVRLTGFGNIDLGGRVGYGIKREVDVPLTSADCGTPEDVQRYGCVQGKEVVAGHRGLNRDSCTGDSGGPLYVRTEEGAWALLGATSRGIATSPNTCGDGGIYVRVDQFVDWIEQVTGIRVGASGGEETEASA